MIDNRTGTKLEDCEDGAQPLPPAFLDWLVEGRLEIFEALERGEFPKTFASHLPVVSTIGGGMFPIHSANKGVGLTPKDEHIPELMEEIDDVLAWADGLESWKASQAERIRVTRLLYENPKFIDPRRFGLIEIFRGTTYKNLKQVPQASLLFTGVAPNWRSYQTNCVAEIIEGGDPRFEFILAMRALFERDRFHVQQPEYPLGYLMWVHEVTEKTPRFGDAGRKLVCSRRA